MSPARLEILPRSFVCFFRGAEFFGNIFREYDPGVGYGTYYGGRISIGLRSDKVLVHSRVFLWSGPMSPSRTSFLGRSRPFGFDLPFPPTFHMKTHVSYQKHCLVSGKIIQVVLVLPVHRQDRSGCLRRAFWTRVLLPEGWVEMRSRFGADQEKTR